MPASNVQTHTDTCGAKKPITVVSLFSGCGGMDLGFLGGFDFLGRHYPRTRFDIVWANEINHAACETYRANIGAHIHAVTKTPSNFRIVHSHREKVISLASFITTGLSGDFILTLSTDRFSILPARLSSSLVF